MKTKLDEAIEKLTLLRMELLKQDNNELESSACDIDLILCKLHDEVNQPDINNNATETISENCPYRSQDNCSFKGDCHIESCNIRAVSLEAQNTKTLWRLSIVIYVPIVLIIACTVQPIRWILTGKYKLKGKDLPRFYKWGEKIF